VECSAAVEDRSALPQAPAQPADAERAGAQVLSLLANPLNLRILRAHTEGPLRATELSEKIGSPAQTTMRASVGTLRAVGALKKHPVAALPYSVANELTPAGEEMLEVAELVEKWLAAAPGGPIDPQSDRARTTVKALAAGWSTTLVPLLAAQPSSLTELDKRIPDVSYPSLERRLSQMRATHQIEPAPESEGGTRYEVTDWLRQSAATLYIAERWEQRHLKDQAAPITATEIEAAFLLALPLVSLPPTATGECLLATPADSTERSGEARALVGVTVEVRSGRVVSAVAGADQTPKTWILGTPEVWLDAIVEPRAENLRSGGTDPQLALDLVLGLHLTLFGEK
jgi:DNA-binding HxlR family transcriptional regulator